MSQKENRPAYEDEALSLISEFEDQAASQAMQRALLAHEERNRAEEGRWLRIYDAIISLRATDPRFRRTMH